MQEIDQLLLPAILIAIIAYFLGCFNGAVIVSKYILRDDIRNHGSGNAGLTNFYRTFGGPLTAVVILCDVLKAIVAVWIGILITRYLILTPMVFAISDSEQVKLILLGKYWAALFCLLGHMFPCMFHFKGGKGILSGGTIAFMLDWRIALVAWGGFLLLAILTHYVSLGSIWAGASFPFSTYYCYQDLVLVMMAIVIGGLIVWQHRENFKRLIHGTENKFSFHHHEKR